MNVVSFPFSAAGSRRRRGWFALIIVSLVAGAYWNSLTVPFFFDDAVAVQRNPTIHQLWPLSIPLSPPTHGGTTTGRPVANLSFAINYAISGHNVWSYHAFNLLIHAAAALALMGIVRRALESAVANPRLRAAADALAFVSAALWAVHPLQTESVVGIAQRTESLCGLFYLLTLYLFARSAESSRASAWQALAVTACLLGMGTKEVMVTAPLMVLLYDRTFMTGSFAEAWHRRRGFYAALAATWLLLGGLVAANSGGRGASAGFGLGISAWSYLLQQCEALVVYLRQSIWPHPLVLDYGTNVPGSVVEVAGQGVVVGILLAATVWALWRRPAWGFLGAWFFVILAPSSSFVPLVAQTMAEHRMYLSLAAIMTLIVVVGYRWLGRMAWFPLGVVAITWIGLTVARNRVYQTELGIWADTVERRPQSARAQLNLGFALQQAGRMAEAETRYGQAIALKPNYVMAHYDLGVAHLQAGNLDEAIKELGTAVRLAPDHADAQVNLGNALAKLGRGAEAVPHYEAALALQPAADVHCNLAIVLIRLGREAEAGVHLEAAAELFEAELRRNPDQPSVHANLGNVRLLQNRAVEAIREYEAALRLNPNDARIRANLETARGQLGEK